MTVDGADEIDPAGDLIKGYGGALVREKIVAALSRRVVIVAGAEKLVPVLGTRGVLPVEVVKFGLGPCQRRLADLGFPSLARMNADKLFVSDGGNYILDCQISPLLTPCGGAAPSRDPRVVGTSLFNLAIRSSSAARDTFGAERGITCARALGVGLGSNSVTPPCECSTAELNAEFRQPIACVPCVIAPRLSAARRSSPRPLGRCIRRFRGFA